MTQEFRTFTQRLTDEPNGTTRVFSVQAKTIVDRFGDDVVDSKGNKIWFPLTFDPAAAVAFGKSLVSQSPVAALLDFRRNVKEGGPWDLQRSYNGQSNGLFASVFTNAASYTYGLIGAAAGFSQPTLMAGAGVYNLINNPKTAGPNFGNNPNNPPFIARGFRDYLASSYGPPANIPDNSFQGNPAADKFKTTFGRSFDGSLDDIHRLAASVANGTVAPSIGFSDPTNAVNVGSVSQDQMTRNNEVAPQPSGSLNDSGAFDSRFGNWPFGSSASSDALSPPLGTPQKYQRFAAPDGPAPASIQGASPDTPAFQPDAMYSPDGNFIGNFPMHSFVTATSPSTASSEFGPGFDPQTTGAPPVRLISGSKFLSSDQDSFDNRFGNWTSSPAGSAPQPAEPAAQFVLPDQLNSPGGLAGWIAALAGIDPQNPNQPALSPQDDQLRGFYRDDPLQPWPIRSLR